MLYPSHCPDHIGRLVAALLIVFSLCGLPPAHAADLSTLSAAVEAATTPSEQTRALVERGEAYRLSGQLGTALGDLEKASTIAPTAAEQVYARTAFGVALHEAGRSEAAIPHLQSALTGRGVHPALRAVAGATMARMTAERQQVETSAMRAARFDEARALIERAALDARPAGPLIEGFVAATEARIILQTGGDPGTARAALTTALPALADAGKDAAQIWLLIGDAAQFIGAPDIAATAYGAADTGDGRIAALAALGLAEASLSEGGIDSVIGYTARAAQFASLTASDDIAFSADWIRAEALSRAGRMDAAASAYEAAFIGLRDFRARAPLGAPPATSARRFAPRRFQLDYIDFLLRTGSDVPSLSKARDLVEDLKLDEIDDYFAERCTPARGRVAAAGTLEGEAAVLYPVVFADRTEVIWTIGGEIGKYVVPMGREALRAEITRLRYLIDLRVPTVTQPARALYDALIAPLAPQLAAASVRTLVIAPDGPLRALPFAALWDGQLWLGQQYGLATILGLGLLDQDQAELAQANVLAAGAEDVGGGYAALPSVPLELEAIRETFDAAVLGEAAFSADALSAEISRRPYDIVHIATHAEFGARPSDNFIVTSEGRLDVTRLEATLRARAIQTSSPVGLLTLSACNTAAELDGDAAERAPLGLAGVGFRAGARSVLASLWPAEDLSTALLMEEFYRALNTGVGRGEALRRAQSALISDPATAEPFQWANFLLIGDWR
ncbi:MAG: CHAT domain-containing protein [Pseudomonadota bacterium]